MYFKLLSIAFIISTLSQINTAKSVDNHCYSCESLGTCISPPSGSTDQFLTVPIGNNGDLSKPHVIMTSPSPKIFNVFTSCGSDGDYSETWTHEEFTQRKVAVAQTRNNKIVFTEYENNCITIGDIRKKAKEMVDKTNAMKSGANVLQINVTVEIDESTYGLRSLGNGQYRMQASCDRKAKAKRLFSTQEKAQKKMDEIVQSSIAAFQIPLGTKKCETFEEIGAKIKKRFSELYPKKATAIDGAAVPEISAAKGVLKYDYEYLSADKCDSDRTMKMWENAETDIKIWANELAENIVAAIR